MPADLLLLLEGGFLLLPVLLGFAYVALVAELCHALCLCEEFLCFVRLGLLNRAVAHLTHEEVVEERPVGLLAVE